jgi:hypothetical protein
MNKIKQGAAALAAILALTAAPVVPADIGINPRASTLGVGAQLTWGVNDSVSIGFEANRFDKDINDSYGGINYRYGIDSNSFAVLGHWYPAGKGGVFRFTGGLYRNDSKVNGTAALTSGSSYTIGNNTYTAAQIGTLTGTAAFDKNAPYVGIGWGGRPGERFGFTFDLGAMYVGAPRVSLSTSGGVVTAADLEIERQQVENDFRSFKWFPLVAVGVYVRF